MNRNPQKSRRFLFWAGWGFHLFFVSKNGDFMGAGKNEYGQLSLGDENNRLRPEKVPKFEKMKIRECSTGGLHSLLLTENDGAFSCGSNSFGQLSLGHNNKKTTASQVVLSEEVVIIGIFCDYDYSSYFLTSSGDVFSAGWNRRGQLGLGDRKDRNLGEKIAYLKNIVNIFTGSRWGFFQSQDGKLFGCGYNNFGQFGLGHEENQNIPVEITFFKENSIKVENVRTSFRTAYFITKEKRVYSCGRNEDGELGNGNFENTDIPKLSKEMSKFDLFCTGNALCFVIFKKNGQIFGCGENREDDDKYSRMGLGESVLKTATPMKIPNLRSLRNVVDIVNARINTYVFYSDGKLVATGYGKILMNGEERGSHKFIEIGIDVKKDIREIEGEVVKEKKLERKVRRYRKERDEIAAELEKSEEVIKRKDEIINELKVEKVEIINQWKGKVADTINEMKVEKEETINKFLSEKKEIISQWKGKVEGLRAELENVFNLQTRAIKKFQEIGDENMEALLFCGLGLSFLQNHQNEKAMSCFKRALVLFRKLGNYGGMMHVLECLPDVLVLVDQMEELEGEMSLTLGEMKMNWKVKGAVEFVRRAKNVYKRIGKLKGIVITSEIIRDSEIGLDAELTQKLKVEMREKKLKDFQVGKRVGLRQVVKQGYNKYFGVQSMVFKSKLKSDETELALKALYNYETDIFSSEIIAAQLINGELLPESRIPPHPNVIKVLHSFVDTVSESSVQKKYAKVFDQSFHNKKTGFIITRLYSRPNLEQYVTEKRKRGKILSEIFILLTMKGLLSALCHLHDHKIVHRDVKMDNCFLSKEKNVILADFGKFLDGNKKTVRDFKILLSEGLERGGAPFYLPPEVMDVKEDWGAFLDYSKCDVFASGLILYWLLTGKSKAFVDGKRVEGNYVEVKVYSEKMRDLVCGMLKFKIEDRLSCHQAFEIVVQMIKAMKGK